MTRIVLIRHGQTAWNEVHGERLRGRAEIELDDMGARQARATAMRLADWELAAVYSSPLKRAFDTASILAEPHELQPQPSDGLIDIDYGRWQGLSLPEAAADDSQLYHLWLNSPHLVTFPNGENLEQVRKRMVGTVEDLVPKHAGETIVLVSHKVACKVLVCSLLGLDNSHFWQVQQDLCAINVFETDENGFAVVRINDTCHLEGLV
ncbi:MAG: histidine phosphatase family protein [Chloroflexi bacterium]|nr:histidine phosphatase family protein [Chloroflexota bacterium]